MSARKLWNSRDAPEAIPSPAAGRRDDSENWPFTPDSVLNDLICIILFLINIVVGKYAATGELLAMHYCLRGLSCMVLNNGSGICTQAHLTKNNSSYKYLHSLCSLA